MSQATAERVLRLLDGMEALFDRLRDLAESLGVRSRRALDAAGKPVHDASDTSNANDDSASREQPKAD
jgi:hypothetical protein